MIYDAIVIGTGISGGWAAKELCEQGLKVLVLERGRAVQHVADYTEANLDVWDLEFRGKKRPSDIERQYKQNRTGYVTHPARKRWFVDDIDHPYSETKRFDWIRGYHVGGRSLMWGRQSYRLSDLDFEANKKDGHGVDWPIRYKDLSPWYDKVEEYIGVSGENRGLPQLPDGKLSPPMELNCVEKELQKSIDKNFDDRLLMIGRTANLTGDKQHEGRTNCQYRNRCMRGCPFGGYFSSNASTLPAAERTGNMTLRPHSIAYEIVYDEQKGIASGVKVIDAKTKEKITFNAKIIFCCASTIASTSILIQSKSKRFPNGLGNDSGELGHNAMDHHFQVGASGIYDRHRDKYFSGRRPNGFYIPRFRNINEKTQQKEFLRGYGFQGSASRTDWTRAIAELSYGKELKDELLKPGDWKIGMGAWGECLPYHDNKITLNYNKLDEWGLPTVNFDVEFKENEQKMREDAQQQAINMLKAAGVTDIKPYNRNNPGVPGLCIYL